MQDSIKEFVALFEKVRDKGYIPTHRKGNTGIGKTFEDACGIVENNDAKPDFKGIEIKSSRDTAKSYITLFTKAPTCPERVNTKLREDYGSYDKEHPDMKVLHTSVFATGYNTHVSGFGYKLEVNDDKSKIYLRIKDLSTDTIEPIEVCWADCVIRDIINAKLKYLAIVEANTRKVSGVEEFLFKKCSIYTGLTYERFIDLLVKGKIMFDIRIGVYKTGTSIGKTHDHGSGFRISKACLLDAFDLYYEIV